MKNHIFFAAMIVASMSLSNPVFADTTKNAETSHFEIYVYRGHTHERVAKIVKTSDQSSLAHLKVLQSLSVNVLDAETGKAYIGKTYPIQEENTVKSLDVGVLFEVITHGSRVHMHGAYADMIDEEKMIVSNRQFTVDGNLKSGQTYISAPITTEKEGEIVFVISRK